MTNWKEKVVDKLPYGPGFLFVDRIKELSEDTISGEYTFTGEEFFYKHHFPDRPITPGVILLECIAQIGLVCLGLYLEREQELEDHTHVLFTDTQVNFRQVVPRGTTVKVEAKKVYYRMGKLKVNASMWNKKGERIASGSLAGMIQKRKG